MCFDRPLSRMPTLKPLAILAVLLVLAGCSASTPRGPASDSTPAGAAWNLVAFGDGTAPLREITATFGDDGDINGAAGCNRYFGTYERDGDGLTVSGLGSTRMMCEPPVMEQERRFLDAVQSATHWAQQGDRLALSDVAGRVLLQFENRGSRSSGERATLTGEVTYRQRIALPPEAVVKVQLQDVSLADAPATTLASHTIRPASKQVPIPFALRYDASGIDARHTYAVRAEIRDASGALIWTTDTTYPVLTRGAPSDNVIVSLVQVSGASGARGGEMDALGRLPWRLIRIDTPDGGSVTPEAGRTYTLEFMSDGRFGGRADCNRYGGSYEADASGDLALSQTVTTEMACRPPSSADSFLGTLTEARTFRVTDDQLWISAGDGRALAFEPANRRSDLGTMEPQPTGRDATYSCESAPGDRFSFRTRTGPGEIAVWLPERFGSQYLVLGQVRAASGAKFEGDGVTVWTKGDEALLGVNGDTFTGCTNAG